MLLTLGEESSASIPAVVFDHMGEFNNILSFFILLTQLECLLIFPAQSCVAVLTVNISHSMKSSQQQSLFSWTTADIYHRVKQIGSALAALERLRDELIVIGQVSAAVDATVTSMAGVEVRLKGLGLGLLHHRGLWSSVPPADVRS